MITTTKCARKACTLNISPEFRGSQVAMVQSNRYNGHCSFRCENLTNNGAKRSRDMNGGIAKNDPRADILKLAGFALEKKYGYGGDRYWKLPTNGATIHFYGSDTYYGQSINLENYNHYHISVKGSYLIEGTEDVASGVLGHFVNVNDAIEYAKALLPKNDLKTRVTDALEPKAREIEALDILEQYLRAEIESESHRLQSLRTEYKTCPTDTNKKLELHAQVYGKAGSLCYLKTELRAVRERRDGDNYNQGRKLDPSDSPAFLYLTPKQQSRSPRVYDNTRKTVLTGDKA